MANNLHTARRRQRQALKSSELPLMHIAHNLFFIAGVCVCIKFVPSRSFLLSRRFYCARSSISHKHSLEIRAFFCWNNFESIKFMFLFIKNEIPHEKKHKTECYLCALWRTLQALELLPRRMKKRAALCLCVHRGFVKLQQRQKKVFIHRIALINSMACLSGVLFMYALLWCCCNPSPCLICTWSSCSF